MGPYRREVCLSVVSIALLILLVIPAVAQLPTGAILGVVKDTTGGVLPNVTVTITNVETGSKRTVMTGDDGTYRVAELLVGHYEVKGEHSGFKTETRKGITLEVTDQAVINLTLEVGTSEQQVVVTGEASVVNTQDATLGGLVNEQRMADLPLNGRNYVDLGLMQPGVTPDKQHGTAGGAVGTSFSANGAPVRSNNFTLDGAILQTINGRNPASLDGTTLGVDGIREFKIITSNFAAEYGLSMGSQMVMVSKGGTNQLHGDVFEYIRNSALDSKNFFDDPTRRIPEFQKNNFGGSAGGPIRKDKTFVFGVFEGVRQNLGVTNNLLVPAIGCTGGPNAVITVAACPTLDPPPGVNQVQIDPTIAGLLTLIPPVPADASGLGHFTFPSSSRQSENYGQLRFDQTISSADSIFGRYTIDNAVFNNATTGLAAASTGANYPNWGLQGTTRNQYITVSENHIFSTSVINTARLSFSRTDWHATDTTNNLPAPAAAAGSILPGKGFAQFSIGGINGGSFATIGPAEDNPANYGIQNIYTLSDDVTLVRGKHAFKFGFLGNRWNEGVATTHSGSGFLTYGSLYDFLRSAPNLVELLAVGSQTTRYTIFSTLGFYGQDDWRATSRLTLNLGLRYEFMTTPHELTGRQSRVLNDLTDPFTVGPIIKNNTLKDFSPRIGLAYDVFGNGKTAVRAGFGIYYDNGNIGSTLQNDAIGTPPFSGLIDEVFGNPAPIPLPLPASITSIPTTSPLVTPQFVDYNAKSPYMIQWNVSVQQQLPWNMGISVAYVGNHGVHLWTVRESNPIFPTSFGSCGDPASLCINGQVPFWDTNSPNYKLANPNMSSTINVATAAESTYRALQVVWDKRISHGLTAQLAFTHSQTMDDTQGQANVSDCTVSAGLQGVYPENPRVADWGPACFDIPNNWQANLFYRLPNRSINNGFLSKAVNGWGVGSIVAIESGQPFSVVTIANRSNSGVLQGQNDRVDVNTPALIAAYPCNAQNPCAYTPVPYDASKVITGDINHWYNTNMFSLPPLTNCAGPGNTNCSAGQLGNSGRDILRNPHFRDWDFSMIKDTKAGFLGEAGLVQFRAEFFNVLNHPNFGPASGLVFGGFPGSVSPFSGKARATAGKITTTQGNARQIQLALRLVF